MNEAQKKKKKIDKNNFKNVLYLSFKRQILARADELTGKQTMRCHCPLCNFVGTVYSLPQTTQTARHGAEELSERWEMRDFSLIVCWINTSIAPIVQEHREQRRDAANRRVSFSANCPIPTGERDHPRFLNKIYTSEWIQAKITR